VKAGKMTMVNQGENPQRPISNLELPLNGIGAGPSLLEVEGWTLDVLR